MEGCSASATGVDHGLGSTPQENRSDNSKLAVPFQNKQILLIELIKNAFYLTNEKENFQSYAFQFLNTSAHIFMEFCPLVQPSFITFALTMFNKLYLTLNPEPQPEIITSVHFDWAMKLLNQCQEYMKPVELRHDNCGDLVRILLNWLL